MSNIAVVLLTVTVLVVVVLPVSAQQMLEDVIYLKNGDVIRGTIITEVIGQSIKIRTSGGSEFTYTVDQITKIAKEPVITMPTIKEKIPFVSFGLSFLVVGCGQAYNGELKKAVSHWVLAVSSLIIILNADSEVEANIFTIIGFTNWAWSMIEAPISADRINKTQRQKQVSLAPIKYDNSVGAKLAFRF